MSFLPVSPHITYSALILLKSDRHEALGLWVGAYAVDHRHLASRQLEAVRRKVLVHVRRVARARDGDDALLQRPAQHHLRDRLALGARHLLQGLYGEERLVLHHRALEGAPRRHDDALLLAVVDDGLLPVGQPRVVLDLVDAHRREAERLERLNLRDLEVGHTQVADQALLAKRRQLYPRVRAALGGRAVRTLADHATDTLRVVQQHEIQVVEAELLEHELELDLGL
mmetsp:Transcript_13001/g.26366  ORF Transcript_13001/g.26366 Transcript_13001/m.26366 type:complete len:227 (+) Transcript_13001:55-735(+)